MLLGNRPADPLEGGRHGRVRDVDVGHEAAAAGLDERARGELEQPLAVTVAPVPVTQLLKNGAGLLNVRLA